MNLLFVNRSDWGGSSFSMCCAVNDNTEHHARHVTMRKNWLSYSSDIVNPTPAEFKELLEWADCWILSDDADSLLNVGASPRPIISLYRGSLYRARHEQMNEEHLGRGYLQACITQDLCQFGPEWLPKPVPDLSPSYTPDEVFTIIHAPTKREQKGTAVVREAVEGIPGVKLEIIEGVANVECLRRKAHGHILIDQVGPLAAGYGGNSLEAWAFGMPTISCAPPEAEKKIIDLVGFLPYYHAETVEEVRAAVIALQDPETWKIWRDKGRECLKKFHDPAVVAKKICSMAEGLTRPAILADRKPIKVSVCMIVKNEEKNLATALESAQGLADEFIVVDTGSTDRTIEIAESMGCKVITGGDPMHKANSRNLAMEHAAGDWIVILDADEKIQDPTKLRSHLAMTNAKGVHIRETYYRGELATMSFAQMRAWPRGAFSYKYRAHEVPVPPDGVWPRQEFTDMVFEHRPDSSKAEWKLQYTLDRILMDVEENPGASRPVYYLGRQYRYLKRWEDALENLMKFLNMADRNNTDRSHAAFDASICFDALGDEEMRLVMLHQMVFENPNNRQGYCELAKCYHDKQQFNIAAGYLRCACEIPKMEESGYRYETLSPGIIAHLLSRAYWRMGDLKQGRDCLTYALESMPDNAELKEELAYYDKALEEKPCPVAE